MNEELIQQARELCEKAIPGPWWRSDSDMEVAIWGGAENGNAATGKQIVVDGDEDFDCHPENAAFIAASRTLVPKLCDALEAAKKEIERLNGKLQDQEYQISLDAMEQSRDEATARAEKAEAALEARHGT